MAKRRKKKKSKKSGSREHRSRSVSHVNKRAIQHYGVAISGKEQKAIILSIQNNEVNCCKLTNTRSIALVPFQGKMIPMIYNKKEKMLHTVLEPAHRDVVASFGDITVLQKTSAENFGWPTQEIASK
jgi:hypothetical protein